MNQRNTKVEFFALLTFLVVAALLLTNGFVARISAQGKDVDVYQAVEPVGIVLDKIRTDYVREVSAEHLAEGALAGMMGSLDRHSSFVTAEEMKALQEDTKGEFEGIGVSIRMDEEKNIIVFKPIPDSPAAKVGLKPFDIIKKIDGLSTEGMSLDDAAKRIRGQKGTSVKLTVQRKDTAGVEETLEFTVKRAKVPLESITEARLLEGGVGYIRISDFKDTTARDIHKQIKDFLEKGMKAFVLDLRWNPGGLLSASQQVCELFLPKGSLVTYTKGRNDSQGNPNKDNMKLFTEEKPVPPPNMPMAVLVNDQTASSAEIVTGALQFHQRAIVLGGKTFGKGSVQTIIPLERPKMTALRLTTALYYTPADVTIDHQGIRPDVEVDLTKDAEKALAKQMYRSYEKDPTKLNEQNHGSVTGNPVVKEVAPPSESETKLAKELGAAYDEETEKLFNEFMKRLKATSGAVDDLPLLRAVEILKEDTVWDNLLKKYHKDIRETQVAADPKEVEKLPESERQLLESSGDAPEGTDSNPANQ